MKIKPTSKKKHLYSNATAPNKTRMAWGTVKVKRAGVRTKPWIKAPSVPFSPLKKGAKMSICDAILSKAGNPYYYVRYNGKYGYIAKKNVKVTPVVNENAQKFLDYLESYHKFIKAHGNKFYYHYDSSLTSFEKAKAKVKKGHKTGITCLVPIRWALHDMHIERKDGKSLIYPVNGSFKVFYNGDIEKKFKRVRDGVRGKTIKEAVNKKLLKPGDIICFQSKYDSQHTFAYSGDGYYMYEGGHANIKNGHYPNGIKPNYKKRKEKISEVLRWK